MPAVLFCALAFTASLGWRLKVNSMRDTEPRTPVRGFFVRFHSPPAYAGSEKMPGEDEKGRRAGAGKVSFCYVGSYTA